MTALGIGAAVVVALVLSLQWRAIFSSGR